VVGAPSTWEMPPKSNFHYEPSDRPPPVGCSTFNSALGAIADGLASKTRDPFESSADPFEFGPSHRRVRVETIATTTSIAAIKARPIDRPN
jgi:hypothetical protein